MLRYPMYDRVLDPHTHSGDHATCHSTTPRQHGCCGNPNHWTAMQKRNAPLASVSHSDLIGITPM